MEYRLEFNTNNYTIKSLTIGNKNITYRAYENIVYVKKPVDISYEVMNIYVPEAYYQGKSIGNYTAKTAPIFLPNMVGGYMPGVPACPGENKRMGGGNAVFVALSKGYVVAAPGARGRISKDEKGHYTGKAPACIVDLKAAVRYLRYNKNIIAGDTEKIISNGTSAGGALSSLLGATGNNPDFFPYLNELGAADERDDIFAASCYCPITNLDNADIAYEWLFNGINDYIKMMKIGEEKIKTVMVQNTMTMDEINFSNNLKALFPAYINGLDLKDADGNMLMLDANGNGNFKDYVKSFIIESAQNALDNGTDLSELTWITVNDKIVSDIDFEQYAQYATRMKPTTAFDGLNLNTAENELFGTAALKSQHFTYFGKENSAVGESIADMAVVKMMNPMNYIGKGGSSAAPYWRIRHGVIDRDTSLAIPVILATKLQNSGLDVNFALPWGIGHAGDYDLNELFNWIDKIF